MMHYVAGFVFGVGGRVLLVRKRQPDWQRDLLNGIGGKIDPGETPDQAMAREAEEEVGVTFEWQHFAVLRGEGFEVYFYRASYPYLDQFHGQRNDVGERLEVRFKANMHWHGVIPNLHYLIPMADEALAGQWPFVVTENGVRIPCATS